MPQSEEQTQRLRNERDRLRVQVAELQFERMRNDIAALKKQLAEVQSFHHAEDGVIQYLATQTEPVDEDRIHAAVQMRRVILLKPLRQLLVDGQVKRSGRGRKGDPFRYAVPGNQNDEKQSSNAGTSLLITVQKRGNQHF